MDVVFDACAQFRADFHQSSIRRPWMRRVADATLEATTQLDPKETL